MGQTLCKQLGCSGSISLKESQENSEKLKNFTKKQLLIAGGTILGILVLINICILLWRCCTSRYYNRGPAERPWLDGTNDQPTIRRRNKWCRICSCLRSRNNSQDAEAAPTSGNRMSKATLQRVQLSPMHIGLVNLDSVWLDDSASRSIVELQQTLPPHSRPTNPVPPTAELINNSLPLSRTPFATFPRQAIYPPRTLPHPIFASASSARAICTPSRRATSSPFSSSLRERARAFFPSCDSTRSATCAGDACSPVPVEQHASRPCASGSNSSAAQQMRSSGSMRVLMGDAARAECHASSDARTATGERCGDRGEVAESAGLGMKTALQIEDGFAGGATLRRRRARERQCEELLRMRRDAA